MAITDDILAALGASSGGKRPNQSRGTAPPPTNSLISGESTPTNALKALIDQLRRNSAFAGGGAGGLGGLQAILDIILGGGGGGGGSTIGGGGGGGGGCLAGYTLVETPDGFIKAEDIKLGSVIMGIDENGEKKPQVVVKCFASINEPCIDVAIDTGEGLTALTASASHTWMLPDYTFKRTDALKVGDEIYGGKIAAMEPVGEGPVYWWTCVPNHTYIAGGVLHHNAGGPQPPQPPSGDWWGPGGGTSGAKYPFIPDNEPGTD